MIARVRLAGVILMYLVSAVLLRTPAFASGEEPSHTETSALFVTSAAPLSAAQSAEYAEAQSVAEGNTAFSATGADEGEGATGLEVLGIILLVLVGVGLLAAAAAS